MDGDVEAVLDRVVSTWGWPRPISQGDLLRNAPVMGFDLGMAPAGRFDQVVFEEFSLPFDQVGSEHVESRGTESEVPSFPTSDEFQTAMRSLVSGQSLVKQFTEIGARLGFRIFIVGGAVRDVLAGKVPKDIDLTGTMPPTMAGHVMKAISIEPFAMFFDEQQRSQLRSKLRDVNAVFTNVSGNGVLHVSSPKQRGPRQVFEKVFEYSTLKQAYLPRRSEGGWRFGTDVAADVSWRDVVFNALYFEPATGMMIDPFGAIESYGLQPSWMSTWANTRHEPRLITPIDIPSAAPAHWAAKAVMRVAKATMRFPAADLGPVGEWINRDLNATAIRRTIDEDAKRTWPNRKLFQQMNEQLDLEGQGVTDDHRKRAASAVDRVLSFLAPQESGRRARTLLAERVSDGKPTMGSTTSNGDAVVTAPMVGVGLCELKPDTADEDRFSIVGEILGSDDPARAHEDFRAQLTGARHRVVRLVEVGGNYLAADGPAGTFAFLDSVGAFIRAD